MLLSHHAEQHLCLFLGVLWVGGQLCNTYVGVAGLGSLFRGGAVAPSPATSEPLLPSPLSLNANAKVLMLAFSCILKHLWKK